MVGQVSTSFDAYFGRTQSLRKAEEVCHEIDLLTSYGGMRVDEPNLKFRSLSVQLRLVKPAVRMMDLCCENANVSASVNAIEPQSDAIR